MANTTDTEPLLIDTDDNDTLPSAPNLGANDNGKIPLKFQLLCRPFFQHFSQCFQAKFEDKKTSTVSRFE